MKLSDFPSVALLTAALTATGCGPTFEDAALVEPMACAGNMLDRDDDPAHEAPFSKEIALTRGKFKTTVAQDGANICLIQPYSAYNPDPSDLEGISAEDLGDFVTGELVAFAWNADKSLPSAYYDDNEDPLANGYLSTNCDNFNSLSDGICPDAPLFLTVCSKWPVVEAMVTRGCKDVVEIDGDPTDELSDPESIRM